MILRDTDFSDRLFFVRIYYKPFLIAVKQKKWKFQDIFFGSKQEARKNMFKELILAKKSVIIMKCKEVAKEEVFYVNG